MPLSIQLPLQMFIAMSPLSGSRSLPSVTLSVLYPLRTPPCYPVVELCHEDPVALEQDQTIGRSHLFTDNTDLGMVQHETLHLGLHGS